MSTKQKSIPGSEGSPRKDTPKSPVAAKLKKKRTQPSPDELASGIISGDVVALSRAITLVESTQPRHAEHAQSVIEKCLPYANRSVRIGITGVPGAGKSTFIETFGKHLTSLGKKVAVLAVDPSSSISGGSILGDKTRMEELVKDKNAFIRPSPSGTSLGGVARKTRETILLCEACGFDTIIVETVGVGQGETAVHGMVDFFLLLKLAGAGDELQGIKRGIMEMADAVVINKADGDNEKAAKKARAEFARALHLYPPKENGWVPKVLTASALKNRGIAEIWELVEKYTGKNRKNGYFDRKRSEQNKYWLLQTIEDRLKTSFYQDKNVKKTLTEELAALEKNETTPFAAARKLLDLWNRIQ
ncbi:methylmalonyl Co-A mutase-associated GTPase MeaB [Sinomicrobium weinanense]|uniref:Methylmalonyl Co-A mutase-associated GTPase MeaB n=1 Tax=Sinomicrobium weinanense TaxID=2842200 RepID=A0A926JSB2_9FLAO|nr:methylmalonyl Co-A mutase-associated GTPase MeaB [Sinomicrobium weinanense]MBC9796595.1 methylmalonyl Co-A mutase-associated GTPase MeaB [Sinomicrobium weinanense]MBU3123579.1 methylmalonyl Co-A mutase-associated GTPase MeaB [Sinomicrobium weinanense]